ncbi:NADP-dependent oxidoreductase domain-containing protein [Lanmaoa asiatica]|nr:NADP-dependent oxidoreductase domain-containing protein [Lanmaoa asiatica]
MSSLMPLAPKPKSRLARYRVLSPHASVHVSPLQLGAMSIGDKWENQDQRSEEFIGEWAEQRGIRDQLVIATKYSSNFMQREAGVQQKVLYSGNNVKSMHVSVDASLKKLRTSYIDILYVHWWDWETSIEEVMNGLHTLVQQGKVLYLGISDTPAWVVSQANQYARDHGLWNVMDRSFERDIIPMCKAQGMAIAPWGILAGGKLRTDEEEERRAQSGEKGRVAMDPEWKRNDNEKAMSAALEKVAKEVGAMQITAVAIAYVMQKVPYVYPIIGGRKVEHLQANLEALEIVLTSEHIKYLESVLPFDPGFPMNIICDGDDYSFMMNSAAYLEKQPVVRAILPDSS